MRQNNFNKAEGGLKRCFPITFGGALDKVLKASCQIDDLISLNGGITIFRNASLSWGDSSVIGQGWK